MSSRAFGGGTPRTAFCTDVAVGALPTALNLGHALLKGGFSRQPKPLPPCRVIRVVTARGAIAKNIVELNIKLWPVGVTADNRRCLNECRAIL